MGREFSISQAQEAGHNIERWGEKAMGDKDRISCMDWKQIDTYTCDMHACIHTICTAHIHGKTVQWVTLASIKFDKMALTRNLNLASECSAS